MERGVQWIVYEAIFGEVMWNILRSIFAIKDSSTILQQNYSEQQSANFSL